MLQTVDHGLHLDRPGGGGKRLRRAGSTRDKGHACSYGAQAGADHQGPVSGSPSYGEHNRLGVWQVPLAPRGSMCRGQSPACASPMDTMVTAITVEIASASPATSESAV